MMLRVPRSSRVRMALLAAAFLLMAGLGPARSGGAAGAAPSELRPVRHEGIAEARGAGSGRFSERTVVVAMALGREGARLLTFTLKDRPFIRPLEVPPPQVSDVGRPARIEAVLLGPGGRRYTQRIDVPGICLAHDKDAAPHVQGDTIRLHHDTVLIEVPEVAGFDRIEVAAYQGDPAVPERKTLGTEVLDAGRFSAAGGPAAYADLAFAIPASFPPAPAPETSGTVYWPEFFGDPEIYTVYGDPAEVSERINVTIVPDGYTYSEKATMVGHANALVAYFRAKTPHKEHDAFFNYILVYAYSAQTGTDQCDCSIVRDTAMSTGFPLVNPTCGHSDNRCLYYGWNCDNDTSAHIAMAELRAPASDNRIVMVNTARHGGCGGYRAVYSAGSPSATEVAVHELGHALAYLADEYVSEIGCGTSASEINTSLNATVGAWPEWIGNLGPPWEGAEYYSDCIYRPQSDCIMRSLGLPFCSVCLQRESLMFFANSRVSPTAPVESMSPASPVQTYVGLLNEFSVTNRLASGAGVTNSITWRIQGPGYPVPTVVATGTVSHSRTFTQEGAFTLTCEVIADTNFIKPEKNGANRDVASWTVNVGPALEDADDDGYNNNVDCDDHNPDIHPGAAEACNGVDDNCNSQTDEGFDMDGDGFTSCGGDCNDALPGVRPGAPQVCDGLNNDCSAPGWPSLAGTNEGDDDGDALSECQGDCDDTHSTVRPGAPQVCDGLNNDCSAPGWPSLAGTNEGDDDGDGFSECGGDCAGGEGDVYPGAPELNDGKDNQCPGDAGSGLVDEISGAIGFGDPGDPTELCWPAQSGASVYEVIRAGSPRFTASCTSALPSLSCWNDAAAPSTGAVFYYLVRAVLTHPGSWGEASSGVERTGLCGAESICDDALDNDADGLTDCADPDCLGQAACTPAVFAFVDTFGDDIGTFALRDFFSALTVAPTDYLLFSMGAPGTARFDLCAERADFYRDSYLSLAETAGTAVSGPWNRWYRSGGGGWNGPDAGYYANFFGTDCVDPLSWCPEPGLGVRYPAVLPDQLGECEAIDLVVSCGDGTWDLTIKIGKNRLTTCGF